MEPVARIRPFAIPALRLALTLAALCSAGLGFSAAARDFQVRYVSADHVYLDGGASDSLAQGDTLQVLRGNDPTGRITVEHASEHSAACRVITEPRSIRVGDTARMLDPRGTAMTASGPPDPVALANRSAITSPATPPPPEPQAPWADVAGNVSFQWYRFDSEGPSGVRHDQPTLRFNIKARRLLGREMTFHAKGRARHDTRQRGDHSTAEEEWNSRLYTFSLTYGGAGAPVTWQIGRLLSNALAPTGPVDGVLIDGRLSPVIRAGAFGGTLPDVHGVVPGSEFHKYGIFVRASRGEFGLSRWSAVAAATAEYRGSTVSRQYVYHQADWQSGRRWSVYEGIEIDLNNGWRREGASAAVSLTNARVSLAYRPTDPMSVTVSYDNRRNFRTWSTRSVADSLFDTAFRNGLRANAHLKLGSGWSASGNVGRRHREGDNDVTWSWGGGVSCSDFLIRRLFMNSQVSGFSSPNATGLNPSATLRQVFRGGHQVSLGGGAYRYVPGATGTRRASYWARVDATRYMTARVYLNGQFEHDWGDEPRGNRIQAELGMAF